MEILLLMMILLSSLLLKSNSFRLFKTNCNKISINDSNNQIESNNIIYKTCKNCKKQYDSKSKDVTCTFHTGIYTGTTITTL